MSRRLWAVTFSHNICAHGNSFKEVNKEQDSCLFIRIIRIFSIWRPCTQSTDTQHKRTPCKSNQTKCCFASETSRWDAPTFVLESMAYQLFFYVALHEDEIAELRKSWALPSIIEDTQNLDDSDSELDNLLHIADVLDGSVPLEGSHAGGEFFQILEEDNLWSERRSVAFVYFNFVENS